jgi:hypothetical protein
MEILLIILYESLVAFVNFKAQQMGLSHAHTREMVRSIWEELGLKLHLGDGVAMAH